MKNHENSIFCPPSSVLGVEKSLGLPWNLHCNFQTLVQLIQWAISDTNFEALFAFEEGRSVALEC